MDMDKWDFTVIHQNNISRIHSDYLLLLLSLWRLLLPSISFFLVLLSLDELLSTQYINTQKTWTLNGTDSCYSLHVLNFSLLWSNLIGILTIEKKIELRGELLCAWQLTYIDKNEYLMIHAKVFWFPYVYP